MKNFESTWAYNEPNGEKNNGNQMIITETKTKKRGNKNEI